MEFATNRYKGLRECKLDFAFIQSKRREHCSIPDVKGLGPWIACDVCDQWYLQKCEGINANNIPKTKLYVCKMCKV